MLPGLCLPPFVVEGPTAPPSPVIVQSNVRAGGNPNSITLTTPPTPGNWLIVAFTSDGGLPGVAAGWTRAAAATELGASVNTGLYYRQALAGDSATLAPVSGGFTPFKIAAWEISGPSGAWEDFAAAFVMAAATIHNPAPLSFTAPTLVLAYAVSRGGSDTPVFSGGSAFVVDGTAVVSNRRLTAGHEAFSGAGSVSYSVNWLGATNTATALVSLRG